MRGMTDCLFCRIVVGEIPADIVYSDEKTIAFRDINPQAPTHVLVIPRDHYATVADLAAGDPLALASLVTAAREVADNEAGGEYRLVFNSGPTAGQSVFHVHGHVIGGTQLGWSPA